MPCLPLDYSSEESGVDYAARRFATLGTMLACLVYGIHFAMFCIALQYMLRSSPCPTGQNRVALAHTVWLFLLATTGIALQIRWNEMVFIDEHSSGSTEFWTIQVGNLINLAKTAIFLTINWFADAMLVWKFYGMFGFSIKMVILPVIVLSSSIVISSVFLRQLAAIGINPWTFTHRTPTIICLALSISVNICLTALIIYRLFHMSRGTYPVTVSCTRIIAMFAESAALYVTTALIFVGLCIERNFAQNMVLPVLEQIQALSPLLITMRVAQSRFWPRPDLGLASNAEITKIRPTLTLKFDFTPPGDKNGLSSCSPATSSSVKFCLPSPLPSVKVKREIVPASDMLDCLNSPTSLPSYTSYSSRCTTSQEDLLIDPGPEMLGTSFE